MNAVAFERIEQRFKHIAIVPYEPQYLASALKDGSYRPLALLRKWIAKLGSSEKRPLGMPVRPPLPVEAIAPPRVDFATLPRRRTNRLGMKLALVPAGSFWMGSPATEAHRSHGRKKPGAARTTWAVSSCTW